MSIFFDKTVLKKSKRWKQKKEKPPTWQKQSYFIFSLLRESREGQLEKSEERRVQKEQAAYMAKAK